MKKKSRIIRKILIGICILFIIAVLSLVAYAIWCIANGGLLEISWLGG